MLLLRVQLMHSRYPGSVGSLHEQTSGNGLIQALAIKAVAHYLSSDVAASLDGPYMDIILCLRYRAVVQIMDHWKAVWGFLVKHSIAYRLD